LAQEDQELQAWTKAFVFVNVDHEHELQGRWDLLELALHIGRASLLLLL
jgi:hypothetical protein